MRRPLTFEEFAAVNMTRCARWHTDLGLALNERSWTGADWSNAMCGEAGEAANVVKKLRRLETGADRGPDDPDEATLRSMLGDEIGDTIAYLFLLAQHYDIDVAEATARKFNRVSERQGFPERLPL